MPKGIRQHNKWGSVVNRTKSQLQAALLLASSAILIEQPALAYEAATQSPASDGQLAEVIVTAQKRSERLLETPIALSAMGSEELAAKGATDVTHFQESVPNLIVTPTVGTSNNASINIRGQVTINNNFSREAAVGIYLNGVPIAKSSGAIFDAVDLERVEVLRGPQGTLYGKNTIGGAINLITKKPSRHLDSNVTVGYGNANLFTARAALDLPALGKVGEGLGEIAMRLSGMRRKRDGLFGNYGPSSRSFDELDQWGGRADVAWTLTERFTVEYGFDFFELDQTPPMLAIYAPGSIPATSRLISGQIHRSRPKGIFNDASRASTSSIRGHALTLSYDIPAAGPLGELTLKSITADRKVITNSETDFDGTAFDLFHFVNNNKYDQLTQELQVVGSTERVSYAVGLFYSKVDWQTYNPRWIFQLGRNNYDYDWRAAVETSQAIYSQISWKPPVLADRLTLSLGGRWTSETKDAERVRQTYASFARNPLASDACVCLRDASGRPITRSGGPPSAALPGRANGPEDLIPLQAQRTWRKFTPMVTLAYQANENLNLYAKYSTGFKSGNFNDVAPTNAAFLRPFDAEILKSWEVGLKGLFLDRRLQLTTAAFLNDYEDFQADVFVPEVLGIAVVNAGKAKIKGLEIEALTRPGRHWEISAAYGFLDTRYKEFLLADGTNVANDRVFPFSPRHTMNLGIQYRFDSWAIGQFSARLDYSYVSNHYVRVERDPTIDIKARGILNGRLTLADIPFGTTRARLSVWGRNLADKEYWTTGINLNAFSVVQWAEPRTYGAEFGVSF
jgi:iron complex outermembrane receptor protein